MYRFTDIYAYFYSFKILSLANFFLLLHLSISPKGVLKYPSTIVDLSIPFYAVGFYFTYFNARMM